MHKQHFRERLFSGNLFREWVAALPEQWQHLPLYLRLYAVLLIGGGLLFQLSYPITLLDSDMWYHLDGGRWFWQQGSVPNHSFFSFIEPERVFVNYYWGFQALIAGIYEFGGYYGLLVLRALIFTLTTVLAYRYIIEQRSRHFPVLHHRPQAATGGGSVQVDVDQRDQNDDQRDDEQPLVRQDHNADIHPAAQPTGANHLHVRRTEDTAGGLLQHQGDPKGSQQRI